MQRLVYVLFQLHEAGRYIRDGRIEQLRLALLLLDNAVEIQLDRRIRDDQFLHEEVHERIREMALRIPEERRSPEMAEAAAWTPLAKGQKRRIEYVFDEKLKYLSERRDQLDARLVAPLSHLHRYRNEAYHRASVRRATIRTAALILFEINCQLLLMPIGMTTYSSNEDYSWLEEHFGMNVHAISNHDRLKEAVDKLRDGMLPTTAAVIEILQAHLTSRVEEVYSALDYIVAHTGVPDRSEAFRGSQYHLEIESGRLDPDVHPFKGFVAKHDLAWIRSLADGIATISEATDRLDAFHRFSMIEQPLEEIEEAVQRAESDVENAIESERRRGR